MNKKNPSEMKYSHFAVSQFLCAAILGVLVALSPPIMLSAAELDHVEHDAEQGRTQNYLLRVTPTPGKVAIDGKLDDWDQSGRIFICNSLENQDSAPAAFVMGMYDDHALYLAAEIRDPTPLRNRVDPRQNMGEGWKGDGTQVRLMFEENDANRVYWLDSWYYAPDDMPALQIQQQRPHTKRIDGMESGGDVAFTKKDDEGIYVQEIRIPWKLLGVDAEDVGSDFDFRMGVEIFGGDNGEGSEPFHLTDLIARRGAETRAFYSHPNRWGRAELMDKGGLEVADFETMPVKIEEHPFLVCSRDDFDRLRKRAQREPWKTMKERAMKRVEKGMPEGDPVSAFSLNRYVSACAVGYIVNPEEGRDYAQLVKRSITKGLSNVEFNPEKAWAGTVPPMGAAFVSIIALDIVYKDLSQEDIQACEKVIQRQINKIDPEGAWANARYGTHGTWDIYRGERIVPDDAFYRQYTKQMTEDGFSTVSPTYAFARLGSNNGRLQKTGYADVLEFTGIDERYYDNPKLEKFYRWLFGYSVDPARQFYLFGDVFPYASPGNGALFWRVGRFDQKAAGYAAWLLQDKQPPGHIMSFVLMDEPLPEPVVPGSRLFDDGGAVMREEPDRPESAGAMLYNITENPGWHSHEETNAISISALGNRLLVNGGWLGDDMRPPWRNNTLAVNGKRHQKRTGAGLAEGLLADRFGYACGDSGDALGDAHFYRSLILVHSSNGCGPYFVVFDEIEAEPEADIQLYFQTASEDEPQTIVRKEQFESTINHHADVEGVNLRTFLAAEPDAVKSDLIPSGYLERTARSGHHYRIKADYRADEKGTKRLTTVLFPHDDRHPVADIQRVNGPDFNGAEIIFKNGNTDLLLQPTEGGAISRDDVSFQGKALIRREKAGATQFYFARQSPKLRMGDLGFESTAPVSVFVRKDSGKVYARQNVELTVYFPNIRTIKLDGDTPDSVKKDENRMRIRLPAGTHEIDIVD